MFVEVEYNKISAANGITSKSSKNSWNNVFTIQQTANKVPPNISWSFEVRRKVLLMFWTPKDSLKVKYYAFSCYEQRNEVCLVYIKRKLQQDKYGNAFSS